MKGHKSTILFFALYCIIWDAEADIYDGNVTVDLGDVTWLRSSMAGSEFKVITPDPTPYINAYSFIKVRAFLNSNINLTLHLQCSAPTDTVLIYAMTDSNIPGDTSGNLKRALTWNYKSNDEYNYTIECDSTVDAIPLWTGEAFYIQSDGDLSGTTISQETELSKTLMEVVTGADGIGVEKPNTMQPKSTTGLGFVVDSAPSVPTLWGSRFIIPCVPGDMWEKGMLVKYVTWYPYQEMRVTDMKDKLTKYSYDGKGAGMIELKKNEPVLVETNDIAHLYLIPYSGDNVPASAAHIVDIRSVVDWYQLDLYAFSDYGRSVQVWVEIIIATQYYGDAATGEGQLWWEDIVSGDYDRFHSLNVLKQDTLDIYTCAVAEVAGDSYLQLYSAPLIIPFGVFVFAKCYDDSCASAATLENGPSSFIDFTDYTGLPPTTDLGEVSPPPPTTAAPTTAAPQPSTVLASTVGPSTDSVTGPVVTAGPTTPSPVTPTSAVPGTSTTASDVVTTPAPDAPENPYAHLCPCYNIENLDGALSQFDGLYLRDLYNEGFAHEKMMMYMDEDTQNRFGVKGDHMSFNDKPVWTHQACEQHLFYHSKEVQYWLMGPDVGLSKGPIVNHGREDPPISDLLTEDWKLHDGSGNWDYDDTVLAECSCAGLEYEALYFDPTETSDLKGYYFIYGQLNGHPVYKHENYSLYLYYYKDPMGYNIDPADQACDNYKTDEYWAIGEYVGGNGPLAYIRDAVYDVNQIGENGEADWRLLGDNLSPTLDDHYLTDAGAKLSAASKPPTAPE